MWGAIAKWLLEHYPVLIFAGVIGFLCFKAASYINRLKRVEEDTQDHGKDSKELKGGIRDIKDSLKQLIIYLQGRDSSFKGLVQGFSPVQLTQLGLDVLKEYGGNEFLNENRSSLLEEIRISNPKTSFDVQNTSIGVVTSRNDTPSFNNIKQKLYNNPVKKNSKNEDIQIDLFSINYVIGITLRNEYLSAHPEIKEDPPVPQ